MYVFTVRRSILEFRLAPRLSLPTPDHLIGTAPACAHALRLRKPIVRQFE
jgi:hypothetical protein